MLDCRGVVPLGKHPNVSRLSPTSQDMATATKFQPCIYDYLIFGCNTHLNLELEPIKLVFYLSVFGRLAQIIEIDLHLAARKIIKVILSRYRQTRLLLLDRRHDSKQSTT